MSYKNDELTKKQLSGLMDNFTLEKKIEITAEWIVEKSDYPIQEVEWLLKKLYVEQIKWIDISEQETMILTGVPIKTFNMDIDDEFGNLFKSEVK
tara:strand:- start:395 stop:679 length:285 start_codon:yes stop_codon:yes gene_type:complete